MTQADLDRVLDASMAIAQRALASSSEFDPFAVIIDGSGRLLAVDLDTSALGKHPDAAAIEEATVAQLRGLADTARCTGLTVNTRLSRERTDAIEVRLEHRDGGCLLVLLPYKRQRFGGVIDYGALATFAGVPEVWR